jgi:hypothetical protein
MCFQIFIPDHESRILDPDFFSSRISDLGSGFLISGPDPWSRVRIADLRSRVVDPDPDPYWIRIQLEARIRIRIRNTDPDPDPGGQK